MQTSGPRSPCPVCQRRKDADCRFTTDVILCHAGSDDRPGTVITIDSQPWYLSRVNGGFDGAAAVYKPHKEGKREPSGHPRQDINLQTKAALARFTVEHFLDAFQRCWDIPDFHSLPPADLRNAFTLIDQTLAAGINLTRSLAPLYRQDAHLRGNYRWRIEAAIKSLRHQQRDAADFRRTYLGEVA